MPTHWESSERPMFVRTVVVNGNRHAILSQLDPLCQFASPQRKPDGFGQQCPSYAGSESSGSAEASRDELQHLDQYLSTRRARSCYQPKGTDASPDLQDCLVKLQVVLGTQDNRRKARADTGDEDKSGEGTEARCWSHASKKWTAATRQGCKRQCQCDDEPRCGHVAADGDFTGFKKGNDYYGMIQSRQRESCSCTMDAGSCSDALAPRDKSSAITGWEVTEEVARGRQKMSPPSDSAEEILKNYSNYVFPVIYVKGNDLSSDAGGDACLYGNLPNPLSDRVLQWLDLARRKNEKTEKDESACRTERIVRCKPDNNNSKRLMERMTDARDRFKRDGEDDRYPKIGVKPRDGAATSPLIPKHGKKGDGDEDIEEEVKQEYDVETALSSPEKTSGEKHPKDAKGRRMTTSEEENPTSGIGTGGDDDGNAEAVDPPADGGNCPLLSIPKKATSEPSVTDQIRRSIVSSFEAIVRLEGRCRSGRKSLRDATAGAVARSSHRRGLLMKQANIRMSSDEEDDERADVKRIARCGNRPRRKDKTNGSGGEAQEHVRIMYNRTPLPGGQMRNRSRETDGRNVWASEKGAARLQLHIFMPDMLEDESASDAESTTK